MHLFSFRRAKKYYFTAVHFISELSKTTKSKSRLKYILVLCNRVLLLISIFGILWFLFSDSARVPVFTDVLYFDNSISSSISDNQGDLNTYLVSIISSSIEQNVSYISNSEKKLITDRSELNFNEIKTNFQSEIASILDKQGRRTAFHLVSDFQLFNEIQFYESLKDTSNQYNLIFTNNLNEIKNVYVDTLYILPSQQDVGKLSVFLRLNTSFYDRGNLVIKLMYEGRQISSIIKEVSELDLVVFDIGKNETGNYEIHLEGDEVTYDNIFYFTVDPRSKSTISIIDDGNSKFLEEAFGNKDLFQAKIYNLNSIDYGSLKKSDLIIVNDHFKLPTYLFRQLGDQPFLILPSDIVDVSTYSEVLDLNVHEQLFEAFEIDFDFKHPLFKGVFEKKIDDLANLYSTPALNISGEYEPIIRYRNRVPFMIQKDKIFLINARLNEESVFQSSALFLPILYQLVFSISDPISESYFYPLENLSINTQVSDVPVRIANSQFDYIPEFNVIGDEMIISIPENIGPGNYFLLKGTDTLRNISINLPKSESKMVAPLMDKMNELFSGRDNVNIISFDDKSESSRFLEASSVGVAMWKYALILALIFVITETILHRYWK